MTRRLLLVIFVSFTVLAACAKVPTKDIQVATDVDPKADLAGYTSYAWLGAAEILNDPHGQWEPPEFDADKEIKFLIDGELRKHGMSENTSNPDLVALFAAGVDMDALKLKSDSDADIEILENVPKGALSVILIDSKSGFVVWMGVARAEILKDIDTETAKARLKYAVEEMFKKFPGK